MTITRDLPASEYHAIKAVSAGMVWTLDSECPLKAWLGSPWNPNQTRIETKNFNIGTAVHLAVLEPDCLEDRVVIVRGVTKRGTPSPGYASLDAQEQRDAAYAGGKTPLLPEEREIVLGMHEAIARKRQIWDLFSNGDAEVTLQWEWNGLPCKCRPDFLAADGSYILDLKSANTVNPRALSRKLETEGWFVRAPWYMAGAKMATGRMPDAYKFVVVEKDLPHVSEVFDIDIRALVQGEQIIGRALDIIAKCQKSGRWPSYSENGETITLSRPSWAEFQHADRDEAGDFQ